VGPVHKHGKQAWTLRKPDGHTITCEFMSHGEWGWELVLYRDGEWLFRHRSQTDAVAEPEATALIEKYLRIGSVLVG
jgi:hypothetical protein